MITRSVKLSEELIRKIDEHIGDNQYSTRADFVLHALRQTVFDYAEIKRKMMEDLGGEVPSEEDIADAFRGKTDGLLSWLEKNEGNQIQINTRVPEGLERRIEILLRPEFGFKKKSDFTRCAVVNLLNLLSEFDGVFYDAEQFASRQKEVYEATMKAVSEGLSKGVPLDNIFDNLKKTLEDKGYR